MRKEEWLLAQKLICTGTSGAIRLKFIISADILINVDKVAKSKKEYSLVPLNSRCRVHNRGHLVM